VNVRASSVDPDVAEMEEKLASVARSITMLLTQPRHDEAKLAELDAAASTLRERILAARPPLNPPDLVTGIRLTSGG
jgi:hypothetical protein